MANIVTVNITAKEYLGLVSEALNGLDELLLTGFRNWGVYSHLTRYLDLRPGFGLDDDQGLNGLLRENVHLFAVALVVGGLDSLVSAIAQVIRSNKSNLTDKRVFGLLQESLLSEKVVELEKIQGESKEALHKRALVEVEKNLNKTLDTILQERLQEAANTLFPNNYIVSITKDKNTGKKEISFVLKKSLEAEPNKTLEATPKKSSNHALSFVKKTLSHPIWIATVVLYPTCYWAVWMINTLNFAFAGSFLITGALATFGIPVLIPVVYLLFVGGEWLYKKYSKNSKLEENEEQQKIAAKEAALKKNMVVLECLRQNHENYMKAKLEKLKTEIKVLDPEQNQTSPSGVSTSGENTEKLERPPLEQNQAGPGEVVPSAKSTDKLNGPISRIFERLKESKRTLKVTFAFIGGFMVGSFFAWVFSDAVMALFPVLAQGVLLAPVINIVLMGVGLLVGAAYAAIKYYSVSRAEGKRRKEVDERSKLEIEAMDKIASEVEELKKEIASQQTKIESLIAQYNAKIGNDKLDVKIWNPEIAYPNYKDRQFYRTGEVSSNSRLSRAWITFKRVTIRASQFIRGAGTGLYLGGRTIPTVILSIMALSMGQAFLPAAAFVTFALVLGIISALAVGIAKTYLYHTRKEGESDKRFMKQIVLRKQNLDKQYDFLSEHKAALVKGIDTLNRKLPATSCEVHVCPPYTVPCTP